jgi:hypothetical protein
MPSNRPYAPRLIQSLAVIPNPLKGLHVKLFLGLCAGIIALLLLAACSNTEGGGDLHVALNEWTIGLDKTSLPEGPINFTIDNIGKKQHELVIIRTDIPPDQLPTKDDGSVNTDAADVKVEHTADEIGDGDQTGRTFTLDAGNYVFIDNTVEEQDGNKTSYYQQGMHVAFTVTKKGESPSATVAATPTASPAGSATRTPTHS